jgi:hypothetical protein
MKPSTVLNEKNWKQCLSEALLTLQKHQGRVWFCISGNSGTGKSTLGKHIRKCGLPGIPPSEIAVIDDGVMTVSFLGVFSRRVTFKTAERDGLAPFFVFLKRKKFVVFVKASPQLRMERCDILLRIECSEEVRRERLIRREKNGIERFERTKSYASETQIDSVQSFVLDSTLCPPPMRSGIFTGLSMLVRALI